MTRAGYHGWTASRRQGGAHMTERYTGPPSAKRRRRPARHRVSFERARQGTGSKGQGTRGQGGRIHPAAQAADDRCGRGRGAAVRAALTTDGELVFLNAVGLFVLDLGALLLRRFMPRPGREGPALTGRALIPRHNTQPGTALLLCPQAGAIQQHNTEGGRDDDGNIDDWQSDDGTRPRRKPRRAGRPAHGGAVQGGAEPEAEQATETPSVAKSLHEARRLRGRRGTSTGRWRSSPARGHGEG